jgi:hypothetical protein
MSSALSNRAVMDCRNFRREEMMMTLDKTLIPTGHGPYRLRLLPVADAPAMTHLRIHRAEGPQEQRPTP